MKNLAIHRLTATFLSAVFLASLPAVAQQDEPGVGPRSLAPLFASHAPMSVTIEAPLTTLMADRPEKEYLEGTLSFTGDDDTAITLDLKIRTRGNYRRMPEHCDFAPVRLNFRKAQVADTLFDGQDKLKLVAHCKNDVPYFDQLVLREYIAYRILQVMTEKSFSVRLFQINYVDTEGASPMTRLGFVIEDDDDVAKRIGMKTAKSDDITHYDLDPHQENLVNVFQFLIGNTDFSLVKGEPNKSCCHNSELMSATDGAPFTPVPFDFDFAGMVNTPYAQPNPRFKLRNVRQRLYRGHCRNNELLPGTFQQFIDKKDAIYRIIDELEWLGSRSRSDVTYYLNGFFQRISNPKTIRSRFLNKCTGPATNPEGISDDP
jgi:hypothetical protein